MIKIIVVILIALVNSAFAQYYIKGSIESNAGKEIVNPVLEQVSNRESFPRSVVESFNVERDKSFAINFSHKGIFRIKFSADKHASLIVPVYFETQDTIEFIVKLPGETSEQYNPELFLKEENIELVNADELTRKFFKMHIDYLSRYKEYREYIKEGKLRGIKDPDYANNYDYSQDKKELDSLFNVENDPFLKKCWGLERTLIAFDEAWAEPERDIPLDLAYYLLEKLEPDSPLWTYWFINLKNSIFTILNQRDQYPEEKIVYQDVHAKYEPFVKYIETGYKLGKDTTLHSSFLMFLVQLSNRMKDFDRFQKYYDELLERYPQLPETKAVVNMYFPGRKIKPGKQIPEFTFASISDNKRISNSTVRGKRCIINFWATWCGPCKGRLKILENIRKLTNPVDLEIINVSMSYDLSSVKKYLEEKIKEIFTNVHLDNWKPKEGVLKDFEIVAIPKTVLIDEDGVILSVNDINEIFDIVTK